MSSTALSTVQQSAVAVRALLSTEAYTKRFNEILGDKRAALFMASIVNYVNASPQLASCDRNSIITSAIVSATLDLPIDKSLGFAYIVPYGTQASFQISYRGIIQLAMRSGQYARMKDACINAEAFGGYDDVGEPIIHWDKLDETEPPVGYCFAWKTVNGFTKTIYWTREHVDKHARRYSKSYGRDSSPWTTNFDAMALKTVIRAGLSKYGILSIDMQRGFGSDDVPMEINEAGDLVPAAIPEVQAAEGAQQPPQVPGETIGEKLRKKRTPRNVTPGTEGNPPAQAQTDGSKGQGEPTNPTPAATEPPPAPAPAPASAPPAPTEAPPAPKNAPGANAGGEGEDPAARQTVIDGVQDKMLELGISETRLMKYALKLTAFVPEGCKSVWDLETPKIAKLKFALPALSVGREPALP